MALKFIGLYDETPNSGSPTIWLDDTNGDLIIQSWKADDDTVAEAQRVGSYDWHSNDIPDHETVIRLPQSMIKYIPRPEETTA